MSESELPTIGNAELYAGIQYREQLGGVHVDGRLLRGYAAVFNQMSRRTPVGAEIIDPGAFSGDALDDVTALFNHDKNMVLGRTQSGTLKLWTDRVGLGYAVELPQSREDVREAIALRNVTGSSFGFIQPQYRSDGEATRLTHVKVLDVGPVLRPAYAGTTAELRNFDPYTWLAAHRYSRRDR